MGHEGAGDVPFPVRHLHTLLLSSYIILRKTRTWCIKRAPLPGLRVKITVRYRGSGLPGGTRNRRFPWTAEHPEYPTDWLTHTSRWLGLCRVCSAKMSFLLHSRQPSLCWTFRRVCFSSSSEDLCSVPPTINCYAVMANERTYRNVYRLYLFIYVCLCVYAYIRGYRTYLARTHKSAR